MPLATVSRAAPPHELHVESERGAVSLELSTHLDDCHAALLAKGTTPATADLAKRRAELLLSACGATRLTDVSRDRFSAALAELRASTVDKRGVSQCTSNHHATAVGQFFRWAVRDRRLTDNPLARLEKSTVTDEQRRPALSPNEQLWLVSVTARETAPERYGATGAERAMVYHVACDTGYRASALAALTRASFDLNADPPTVTLARAATKNRRGAVQPVAPELAEALKTHLATKAPGARALNVPPKAHTAEMIRADLADARAAWLGEASTPEQRAERDSSDFLRAQTEAGAVVFHGLRHTFGSDLARAGAPVKVAMDLMRLGDVNLSMRLYSRTLVGDRAAALGALPDLTPRTREAARATGSDHAAAGAATGGFVWASCWAQTGQSGPNPLDSAGRTAARRGVSKVAMNAADCAEDSGRQADWRRTQVVQGDGLQIRYSRVRIPPPPCRIGSHCFAHDRLSLQFTRFSPTGPRALPRRVIAQRCTAWHVFACQLSGE